MQNMASEYRAMLKLSTSLERSLSSQFAFLLLLIENNRILILEEIPVNQEFFSVHPNKIFMFFRTTKSIQQHVVLNFQKMSA